MKTIQLTVLLAAFGVFMGLATVSGMPKSKKSETAQIQQILQTVDFGKFVSNETKFQISFFVNAKNEIIVTATNNDALDEIIKNSLNYHKIGVENLEYNQIYTLPVHIKILKHA